MRGGISSAISLTAEVLDAPTMWSITGQVTCCGNAAKLRPDLGQYMEYQLVDKKYGLLCKLASIRHVVHKSGRDR